MGRTIFEMLVDKAKGPISERMYNPLKLKVGNLVNIDHLDLRGSPWQVENIREYNRTVNGAKFQFTDYALITRPFAKEEQRIRLRVNPLDKPDKDSGLLYNVLALWLYDSTAYDKNLAESVGAKTGVFDIFMDGLLAERYWRVNDVTEAYHTDVRVCEDAKATSEQDLKSITLNYWDFWREIRDEAGMPFNQFMFIESNTDDGWFEFWRGFEIDSKEVEYI